MMRHGWIAMAALALAACGGGLTAEKYAQIKIGMEYTEVTALIGKPDRCDEAIGLKTCTWGDDKRGATLRFVGEKVVFHSSTNLR